MAVLNKEDLFNKIKERIGDATDEETLTFVEDVTDTFNASKIEFRKSFK